MNIDSQNLAFATARRHSRAVRVLRIALPAAASLILLASGYEPAGSYPEQAVATSAPGIENGKSVMSSPVARGTAARGRPYEAAAERALRSLANPEMTDFEKVSAKVPIGEKGWAWLESPAGSFNETSGVLVLAGPATVRTEDGMSARFASATVLVTKQEAFTDQPVEIRGRGMYLTADSAKIRDGVKEGRIVAFEGNVRLEIAPRKEAKKAKASADGLAASR